jgi:hypothetical protein
MNRKRKEGGKEGIFFFNCKRGGGGAGDLGQYTLLLWSRKGGGPRMRSAVQGWTWALRGLGAQSTAAAGSASLQPPLPEDDDDDSRNSPFMALEGILPSFLPPAGRLKRPCQPDKIPSPEELSPPWLRMYCIYLPPLLSLLPAVAGRSVQD